LYFVDKPVHEMLERHLVWENISYLIVLNLIMPFLPYRFSTQALLWQSDKCAAKSKYMLIPKLLSRQVFGEGKGSGTGLSHWQKETRSW